MRGPSDSAGPFALILHWNGKVWKRQPIPPWIHQLYGVAATSPTNALGRRRLRRRHLALERKDLAGGSRAPHLHGVSVQLDSVTATSRTNAWAVGYDHSESLILHWNGKAWRRVRSPTPVHSPAGQSPLYAVASSAADNAWGGRPAISLRPQLHCALGRTLMETRVRSRISLANRRDHASLPPRLGRRF